MCSISELHPTYYFLYEFFIRDILQAIPLGWKKRAASGPTVMTVNGPDLLAILKSILLRAIPHWFCSLSKKSVAHLVTKD